MSSIKKKHCSAHAIYSVYCLACIAAEIDNATVATDSPKMTPSTGEHQTLRKLAPVNSDSVEATLLKILKRSADKGYVQKQDMVKAKAALNKYYAEKCIELIGPNDEYGSLAVGIYRNDLRDELRAKVKKQFNV